MENEYLQSFIFHKRGKHIEFEYEYESSLWAGLLVQARNTKSLQFSKEKYYRCFHKYLWCASVNQFSVILDGLNKKTGYMMKSKQHERRQKENSKSRDLLAYFSSQSFTPKKIIKIIKMTWVPCRTHFPQIKLHVIILISHY